MRNCGRLCVGGGSCWLVHWGDKAMVGQVVKACLDVLGQTGGWEFFVVRAGGAPQ
ncbi:hypothetical protein [Bartonella sp. CL162QHHD]|uniref:hypothetical protein n=1 Tax=Bartonella sp. CL162QHHD TaxID=3243516 RepID=UPI0035D0B945